MIRIAFLGSGAFALPSLRSLSGVGTISLVATRPPRPAGRGKKLRPTPVAQLATERAIPLAATGSREALHGAVRVVEPDLGVVVDFGMHLPDELLALPRLGFLNVHPSLLPRWRGAAPVPRAMLAGDDETGVSILQVVKAMDAGPVAAFERVPIDPRICCGELEAELAERGARLLAETVQALAAGARVAFMEQDSTYATRAPRLTAADQRIDWTGTGGCITRQIRALSPMPGAWARIRGERIRLLDAIASDASGSPGVILANPLVVGCGQGAVQILRAQRPGKRSMEVEELLRGFRLNPGERFEWN